MIFLASQDLNNFLFPMFVLNFLFNVFFLQFVKKLSYIVWLNDIISKVPVHTCKFFPLLFAELPVANPSLVFPSFCLWWNSQLFDEANLRFCTTNDHTILTFISIYSIVLLLQRTSFFFNLHILTLSFLQIPSDLKKCIFTN